MRLWHKDLIPVLPTKQLIAQWRELCAIAGSIDKNGTPNHLLVNKVLNYPPLHYIIYTDAICEEMKKRGYVVSRSAYTTLSARLGRNLDVFDMQTYLYVPKGVSEVYRDWHNERYLIQCYSNLQEKFDCGGIPKYEWDAIEDFMERRYANDDQRSRSNPRIKSAHHS